MRAVHLTEYGGPDVLRVHTVPDLQPGLRQVRIRVAAAGINRADAMQRAGNYPQPGLSPAFEIPGLEVSGTVDLVGAGVTEWRPGDQVMALLPGGGYAEQALAHAHMLMPVPAQTALTEAAGIPEVYFTAYDALVDRAHVAMGETVLVHSGGSGVGTAAIQLAKAMGATVFVTVGSERKAQLARELGADRAIVYRTEDFADAVLAETGGRGADVILDVVGAPYFRRNIAAAAPLGRIVLIGLQGGERGEIDVLPVVKKRLELIGTTLRARTEAEKQLLTQRFTHLALPLFAAGRLRSVVDKVFPFDAVADAHRYLEENRHFGKVVLQVQSAARE